MNFDVLARKYPVGKVLCHKESSIPYILFYHNRNDIQEYKKRYGEVEILSEDRCRITEKHSMDNKVDGWIFDGKTWWPAYDTWDGWVPYTEEELEKFEEN